MVPRREIFKGRILGCFGERRASDSVPEKSRAFGEEKGVNSLRQRRQPRWGALLGPGCVLGRGGVSPRIHGNLRASPREGSCLCCQLGLVAGRQRPARPAVLACPWSRVGPGPVWDAPHPRVLWGSITCSYGPKDADTRCPHPGLQVNVLALSICTREAYQSMRERKVDDGHIININRCGGGWGQVPPPSQRSDLLRLL